MNTQTFSIEPLESRIEMKRFRYHCHYGSWHFHRRWFWIYIHRHVFCHWGWV